MSTESRNPRSIGLDRMSAREIVRLMNEEEQVVAKALEAAEESLAIAAEKVADSIRNGGRIFYVGAGTSGRIGQMDAAEMPPTFGVDPDMFIALQAGGRKAATLAVEAAEDHEHDAVVALNELNLCRLDVVFGITASGATPFPLAAVRHGRQKGAWTCGIANNRNSKIFGIADHSILLNTGPEVLTGSTRLKAGTAQKLALNRISTTAMVLSGKVIENLMIDVRAHNRKLKDRAIRILRELAPVTQHEAEEILEASHWSIRAALENAKSFAT